MRTPRIYSINTVGILKHYCQEYLLHPVRTDFVGDNGVGKSIIADILQLIFVVNKEYIEFGTDGLNKEGRTIPTLPYKTNEAYAFVNIEVTKDMFVTMGVCIPARTGIRLKPFLILNEPAMDQPLEKTAFCKDRLLTWRDFLNNQKAIIPLPALAKQLSLKHKLYLLDFKFKDEVEKYYSFLYNKQIFPINLGIKENLKAFAKVIQSFSKAKTLNLSSSNSLKEFLLENIEKEFESEYHRLESQLDKLLREYKELENSILDMEQKQSFLINLKQLEEEKNGAQLAFKKGEFTFLFSEWIGADKRKTELAKKLVKKKEERDKLTERGKKIQRLEKKADQQYKEADDNLTCIIKYRNLFEKFNNIEEEEKKLKEIEWPYLTKQTFAEGTDVELLELGSKEIIEKITFARKIFTRYGQFNEVDKKLEEQQREFDKISNENHQQLSDLKKIRELLNSNDSTTLFQQVVKEKKGLSENQESVLLSMLNMPLGKPQEIGRGTRYVLSTTILDENNFEPDSDNDGLWLRLGELREFIPRSSEKRLFQKSENLEKALVEKSNELDKHITCLEQKSNELAKVRKSLPYDKSIIPEYEFDLDLMEYSTIERLKEAIFIINSRGLILDEIENEKEKFSGHIEELNKKITITIKPREIDKQIEKIENAKKRREKRKQNIAAAKLTQKTALSFLNAAIPLEEKELKQKIVEFEKVRSKYLEKEEAFKKEFSDIPLPPQPDNAPTETEVQNLKNHFNVMEKNYHLKYQSILSGFAETSDKKNERINLQISQKAYQFKTMEEVLLGPKIGHLDKIPQFLREANQQRLSIMDNIRENMLKIFSKTEEQYEKHEELIKNLNNFFMGKKISDTFYFKINFKEHEQFKIDWIRTMQTRAGLSFGPNQLPLGVSVQKFIEEYFKKLTGIKRTIYLTDLLNPKTYFELSVSLTDENKKEIPGSTGEAYSAIVLLGIARFSRVQQKEREGVKFIILEETANLDNTNFNIFPKIAEEYGYQIITMTPKPYGSDSKQEWYLHHLIKGSKDKNINYHKIASYFKTKDSRQDLETYLASIAR